MSAHTASLVRERVDPSGAPARFVLREGRLQDAAACAAILDEWIDENDWMPRLHSSADIVTFHRDVVFAEREVRVAEGAHGILGYIAIEGTLVTALYVRADIRGAGIGAALLTEAKRAHPAGLELWAFLANEGALRFYRRERFAEVRRTDGDNEERRPDVLLGWRPGA